MQAVHEPFGREQRGLHAADMGADVAGQRVHPALAARAPEQRIEGQAEGGGRAIGGAGRLRGQAGEQHRLGVQQEGELVVSPGGIELREPGDVEPAGLEAADIDQGADPGEQWIEVVVDVPGRAPGSVPGRGSAAPAPGGQSRIEGEPSEVGEAVGRAGDVDEPRRLPHAERQADPRNGLAAEAERRTRIGRVRRAGSGGDRDRPDGDREDALPAHVRRTKPVRRPKLDGFTGIVDAILEADTDPDVPRKQRHTAHRIFERLRDEHGFTGGYTIVKDYVWVRRQSTREAFVPLHHPPGHAQVDFGEAVVELRGQREKVAFFCLILPHSNVWFVKVYPRETTEAFFDGHVSAFAFLGGVPRSILYDNTTLAVARILGDGTRRRTQAFTHLQSHYLFRDRFGRPGKGNDKGKVEALVKTARRKFLVPIPKVHDLSVLNERLLARCLERLDALEQGDRSAVLLADLDALRDLPAAPFEACEHVPSTALVRYRLADYSAPAVHAHKKVTIKGYVDRVEIALGAEIVARHRRSYVHGDVVYDPLHYLSLLEKKPGALDQAAPLRGWKLDPAFDTLRRLLEARFGPRGKRDYIQVLRLLEDFPERQVTAAVRDAVKRRLIGFDAVKHLLLARIERRPVHLDLSRYPHLPQPFVAATRSADYATLLAAGHG